MKLMGAVCIAAAALWGRWQQLSVQRRRRETLRSLIAALYQMAEEIRIARPPMPQLLECIGRSRGGAAGGQFRRTAALLRREYTLAEAWRGALEGMEVSGEAMTVLRELAAGLQGDEEAVCRSILRAVSSLERLAEMEARQRWETERRGNALWFSGSALLVILLL